LKAHGSELEVGIGLVGRKARRVQSGGGLIL